MESEESIGPLFRNSRGGGNGYTDRGRNGKEILIQNCEEEGEEGGQDQEFFSEPYRKLSKVYNNFELYNSKTGIE